MNRDRIIAYAASLIAGVTAYVVASVLGAPTWGAWAVGYLSFALFRVDDRLRGLR